MNNQSGATQDIPVLESFVQRLLQLVRLMLDAPVHYEDQQDHFAFMALCFVSKQAEHLQSALALVRSGDWRDAVAIARSMLEGLSLLTWAAQDKNERAWRWRTYAWVEDLRLLRAKEKAGEAVPPQAKRDIEEQVKKYGPTFYTKKAQEATRTGALLRGDPYVPTWYGRTVRDIFTEVQGERLHQHVYDEASRWLHWSPRGLAAALRQEGDHVRYVSPAPEWAATALAGGFQALLESTMLLDSHLRLGFGQRLSALRDEYIQRLSPVRQAASFWRESRCPKL